MIVPRPDPISIGCQSGGPKTGFTGVEKVGLYKALISQVTSTHCQAIDSYDLVLRVDGSLQKFGEEGLARLRFAKKRRYITVDIQIPESVWRPLSLHETRRYIAAKVRDALRACVARLASDGLEVKEEQLFREVDAAIRIFLLESSQD